MVFSIIIPAYNCDKYINGCLDSIISQYRDGLEVIIVNDGSTDNTKSICESYANSYRFIKLVNQVNSGVSKARNRGINEAQGDYLFFVDSDDRLDASFLDSFSTVDADFAICGYSTFFNRIIKQYYCNDFSGSINDFCKVINQYIEIPFLLSPWAKMFSSKIIRSYNIVFNEKMSYCEDALFVFEYLLFCKKIVCLSAPLYLYRTNNKSSLSSNYKHNMYECSMLMNNALRVLLTKNGINNDLFEKRVVHDFCSCSRKLILSRTNYTEKKDVFYKEYNEISRFLNYSKLDVSKTERFVLFIAKHPRFFALLYIFRIREIL